MNQIQKMFRDSFPDLAQYADQLPLLLRDPIQHGYRAALLMAEGALGRVDAFALLLHFADIDAVFLDFISSRPGVRGHGIFTGYSDETGQGAGLGYNLNLPLPPGTDEKKFGAAFRHALDRIVQFKPDILIVGLGFDILKGDPTGTFTLTPRSMRILGRHLMKLGFPLLVVQEGGYNIRNIRNGAYQFFAGCTEEWGERRD